MQRKDSKVQSDKANSKKDYFERPNNNFIPFNDEENPDMSNNQNPQKEQPGQYSEK